MGDYPDYLCDRCFEILEVEFKPKAEKLEDEYELNLANLIDEFEARCKERDR